MDMDKRSAPKVKMAEAMVDGTILATTRLPLEIGTNPTIMAAIRAAGIMATTTGRLVVMPLLLAIPTRLTPGFEGSHMPTPPFRLPCSMA